MKNKIQAEMYEPMKNMTREERLKFIHQRAEIIGKKLGNPYLKSRDAKKRLLELGNVCCIESKDRFP